MLVVVIYATDLYRQEANQKLNSKLANNIVKEKLLIKNNEINREAFEYVFHILMVINPSIELYLLDPQGNVLEYSAAPGKVKRNKVSLDPINEWISGKAPIPLRGDDPRNLTRKKVFSAAPIYQGGKLEGYLYVILGGEDYDTIFQKLENSFILKLSSWLIIGAIACALLAGLMVFSLLTRRLRKLAEGISAFKKGEDLAFIDLPRKRQADLLRDEIDQLSNAFREMAERIEEQIAKLKKSDLLRRELIANVSHDLRTPLATLTVYIETLQMNKTDTSPQDRQIYLEVAGKHCKWLSSLVDNLFELARLDSEETKLNLEPFSIAELIQDVVQNYELTAKNKNIQLTSNIGSDLCLVMGDIGLVQRVLENLIMNALRHTPEGGKVSILINPADEYVNVQVVDTGVGISEEALPNIFDRFYSIESDSENSTSFSGLGLAIARRIMDLHGTGISVESKIDFGTSFTLAFPVYHVS